VSPGHQPPGQILSSDSWGRLLGHHDFSGLDDGQDVVPLREPEPLGGRSRDDGDQVLIADPETVARLGDAELRRTALALAKEHGFSHVAIELRSDTGGQPRLDAPLSRD